MSIKVGQKFDSFEVVHISPKGYKAALRWNRYHTRCCIYEMEKNKKKKEGLGRWLDKECASISNDQYMMGIGLIAYNQFLREKRAY